jgi:hypothetical protein
MTRNLAPVTIGWRSDGSVVDTNGHRNGVNPWNWTIIRQKFKPLAEQVVPRTGQVIDGRERPPLGTIPHPVYLPFDLNVMFLIRRC